MGRRLSGRVGEEVRRVEGRVGEGIGVGGECQERREEDMACKFRNEGGQEMTGRSRIVRRVGRISNIVKTLELWKGPGRQTESIHNF